MLGRMNRSGVRAEMMLQCLLFRHKWQKSFITRKNLMVRSNGETKDIKNTKDETSIMFFFLSEHLRIPEALGSWWHQSTTEEWRYLIRHLALR